MSTEAAQQVLRTSIEEILKEYTRGTLDKQIHVIDISYDSLRRANARRDTPTYRNNWQEFRDTAYNLAKTSAPDYLTAVQLINKSGGTYYLQDEGSELLISKNFDAARAFITKVSNQIKTNDDFGIAFRGRNYTDIETSRKLARVAGSMFLQQDVTTKKFGVYEVSKLPGVNKYGLIPVDGFGDVKEVLYLAQRRSTNYTKTTSLREFDNLEVELVNTTENGASVKKVAIKKRLLSVLDLGHGQGELSPQSTPAGVKISNILNLGLGPKGKALVEKYLNELRKLHNVVQFKFENTSDSDQASGYIVLSVQKYTRNNVLSIGESGILNLLRKNLSRILKDVPGSNTIAQDAGEALKNNIVAALTGKPVKKIKPHKPATGKASPKTTVKAPTTGVKTTRPEKILSATPKFTNIQEASQVNLTSLLSSINRNLTDAIKRNMGDGNRTDILNLRSGRFAESVKVERLSESREGMITAFYTYMKNPYATFSQGGDQQFPRTRDPKLLISKSIREIATQQVANRLRAVAI